jgi:hypothetical protein
MNMNSYSIEKLGFGKWFQNNVDPVDLGRDVDYKLERSISVNCTIYININSIGLMLWFYDQKSVN